MEMHLVNKAADGAITTATINGAPASCDEGTKISLTSNVTDPGSSDTVSYLGYNDCAQGAGVTRKK